jgi:hypothetical protein
VGALRVLKMDPGVLGPLLVGVPKYLLNNLNLKVSQTKIHLLLGILSLVLDIISLHCSSISHIQELTWTSTDLDADDEYEFDDVPMTAEEIAELDRIEKAMFACM